MGERVFVNDNVFKLIKNNLPGWDVQLGKTEIIVLSVRASWHVKSVDVLRSFEILEIQLDASHDLFAVHFLLQL
jgi:hypothetical protein